MKDGDSEDQDAAAKLLCKHLPLKPGSEKGRKISKWEPFRDLCSRGKPKLAELICKNVTDPAQASNLVSHLGIIVRKKAGEKKKDAQVVNNGEGSKEPSDEEQRGEKRKRVEKEPDVKNGTDLAVTAKPKKIRRVSASSDSNLAEGQAQNSGDLRGTERAALEERVMSLASQLLDRELQDLEITLRRMGDNDAEGEQDNLTG
jgi:co-chaperonin GroES (HSP10)